jgi:hypothetical protein
VFQDPLPLARTCTVASLRTNVLCTSGAATPPLPERSTGLSQRGLPPEVQVRPDGCATECEALKLTRISGVHSDPVHAAWALWQPGASYSTVAGSVSRVYEMPFGAIATSC